MGTKAGRDSRTQASPPLPGCTRRVDGIELALHVQPGARRNALVGWHGDRLKLAVAAPAIDGRANAAVIELVAAQLGVARRAVTLVAGSIARDKRVRVTGLPDELLTRLAAALGSPDGDSLGRPANAKRTPKGPPC